MLSKITYVSIASIGSDNNRAMSTTSLHKDEPQVGNMVVVKYAYN